MSDEGLYVEHYPHYKKWKIWLLEEFLQERIRRLFIVLFLSLGINMRNDQKSTFHSIKFNLLHRRIERNWVDYIVMHLEQILIPIFSFHTPKRIARCLPSRNSYPIVHSHHTMESKMVIKLKRIISWNLQSFSFCNKKQIMVSYL